jgi:tetratricopeptide (TPR) repeat protein/nucleoside phosphorylase
MEKSLQSFDVCVVCALPEEARAFLEITQQQCQVVFEKHISSLYKYDYRFAAIKNDKGEPLNLHISWLPRYGPQEMTLHLSRVLEECQPRIAIMTGICAGDAQQAQLGDLVVAERTFTYDNGKFTLDEQGRSVHRYDTMTYQLDANILQFLGLFDDWKLLVAHLKRPPTSPERRKRRTVACHIKAMASGSAVRSDNPFEDVRAPVRGTVAIDMEGAAFGLVMSRHPLIRWLVVKGVCDYADRDKTDVYHNYSACASALYALSFIRAYVINERLPRPDGPSPSSRVGPPRVWNIPHTRNPHFTGRDDLLDWLHQHLTPTGQSDSATTRRAALAQPLAIKGLGGVGKTQIAVEYAYRSRDLGRYTHTLWVNAASEGTLITSFTALAELLPEFPAKDETDQSKLVKEIKRWLEQCEQHWLLIFDNADDDPSIIEPYLPRSSNGSILLTTRAHAIGSLAATTVEVETMGFLEGTQLLLRRAGFEHASEEEVNRAGDIVVVLDHFPLALDQAGAYIEETQCSFENYRDLYQTHRQKLLARRGKQTTNYPDSVATTWSLSFQKVEQANPAAAELLRLCAFLAPDKLPEELIRDGAAYWTPELKHTSADLYTFNQMIEELLKFSLVKRLVKDRTLSIHRLVQEVQKDRMEPETQHQWAERAVRAINAVFPDKPQDIATWPLCLRYLDQVQACHELIEHYGLVFVEAASILNRAGLYLDDQALYAIAEPLYQRALAIREQQLGATHPQTATSLNNLAILYKNQGKYEEAEPLLKRALAVREEQLGVSHPSTAISLNNLAFLYYSQGKYEEAEPLYLRTLAINEQQLGASHPHTATSLDNLATLYTSQGKYSKAEQLYQRALAIREQQLGATHPQTATNLDNLAHLYQVQGKYEEAEPLLKRALAISEEQLGATHPDTAASLNNLATLYDSQGKYEEAEPLLKRALAISEQQLGARHPSTATSCNNLAGLYESQGKYEEAEPLLKRALAIREEQLGAMHPDTAISLNSLAFLYYSQGKYEEAEPLLKRALAISEQQLGTTHSQTQQMLNNYLMLLAKIHTGGDLEALLHLLAQTELGYNKDERNTEETSS